MCAAVIFSTLKSKLHFTCAAVQAFKETKRLKTVTSAAASSHAPGASAEGPGCVDPAACNFRSLPLLRPRPAASSHQQLFVTIFTVHPPPWHHDISLSLPEESLLFLMHLCSGHGGGLPSAPHLLHAIAHAWPRGQHRSKNRRIPQVNVCKTFSTVKI